MSNQKVSIFKDLQCPILAYSVYSILTYHIKSTSSQETPSNR